jgi:hypothetical protein
MPALPFGPLDPAGHRTLELGLRSWVREQTGLELGYVEQLYTFADRNRDPASAGGPRVVSIAYLALVREAGWRRGTGSWPASTSSCLGDARRASRADQNMIAPALARWVARPGCGTRRARREPRGHLFGLRGAAFDSVRVLERSSCSTKRVSSRGDRDAGVGRVRARLPADPRAPPARASRWRSTIGG